MVALSRNIGLFHLTMYVGLILGARIFYGMAKDGSLPSLLGLIHSKTKTPWIAVLLIFFTSVAFSFIEDIMIVANIVLVIITFFMINLSVIILRHGRPKLETLQSSSEHRKISHITFLQNGSFHLYGKSV